MGFGGGIWHAGHAWGNQYGGPSGKKGGRGRQGRGKSKRRRGAGIGTGAVVVATIIVVAFVVAIDQGGEGAANNLGDRGRSYGGPQREGRVIVQGG